MPDSHDWLDPDDSVLNDVDESPSALFFADDTTLSPDGALRRPAPAPVPVGLFTASGDADDVWFAREAAAFRDGVRSAGSHAFPEFGPGRLPAPPTAVSLRAMLATSTNPAPSRRSTARTAADRRHRVKNAAAVALLAAGFAAAALIHPWKGAPDDPLPTAAAGWHSVTQYGITVDVPDDWGWAGARISGGRCVAPAQQAGPPVVATSWRLGLTSVQCADANHLAAVRPTVSFAPYQPETQPTGNVVISQQVDVGGGISSTPTVTVTLPALASDQLRALAEQIIDSARTTSVDASDCPTGHSPSVAGDPAGVAASDVTGARICQYDSTGAPVSTLVASRTLDATVAGRLLVAAASAPRTTQASRSCSDSAPSTYTTVTYLLAGGGFVTELVRYDSCVTPSVQFAGSTHTLTTGNCAAIFALPVALPANHDPVAAVCR